MYDHILYYVILSDINITYIKLYVLLVYYIINILDDLNHIVLKHIWCRAYVISYHVIYIYVIRLLFKKKLNILYYTVVCWFQWHCLFSFIILLYMTPWNFLWETISLPLGRNNFSNLWGPKTRYHDRINWDNVRSQHLKTSIFPAPKNSEIT